MIEHPRPPADCRILYFSRDRAAFGFLSHFHPAAIELDGESWRTGEHYYQAQKSDHPEYRAVIRSAVSSGMIEDSPLEPFWGTESGGNGQNWAGRVLMEIRDDLRQGR